MNKSAIQHPKVVVIGAGSLFFGRQAIWQMVHSPYLNQGTLALVDTDSERLKQLFMLAEMVVNHSGVNLKIEASSDRRDVLSGADFVVLSFASDTVKYRGIDCAISEKYGIRMCSGDTIGPGGIFRAMREFPVILKCAKDMEELCPDAWVINYINPTAVHGLGLRKYAPKLKSFALCDGLHMPNIKKHYAVEAGIIQNANEYSDDINRDFDLQIAGVNHFTWIIKAEYKGQDVTLEIAGRLRIQAESKNHIDKIDAKKKYNAQISYELFQVFGYLPACVAHTKEYLRYWQGHGIIQEAIPPLSIWETGPRYEQHKKMWRQIGDFISGNIPINEYMTIFGPDHATDIIENMVGNLGKPFYINTFNEGAVPNMRNDAFLELLCDINLNGIIPRAVNDMPKGIRALQELVLETHELTAEAIAECSYGRLREAMLIDPLANSIGDTEKLIAELMECEREQLPECWFTRKF